MQNLLQVISTRCIVDTDLRDRLEQDFDRIEVSKGHKLLQQDRRARTLYFIGQGVVHNYYRTEVPSLLSVLTV